MGPVHQSLHHQRDPARRSATKVHGKLATVLSFAVHSRLSSERLSRPSRNGRPGCNPPPSRGKVQCRKESPHMRVQFSACMQGTSSADNWLCNLRELARKCEFHVGCCNNCEPDRLLGQIMVGASDPKVLVDLNKALL